MRKHFSFGILFPYYIQYEINSKNNPNPTLVSSSSRLHLIQVNGCQIVCSRPRSQTNKTMGFMSSQSGHRTREAVHIIWDGWLRWVSHHCATQDVSVAAELVMLGLKILCLDNMWYVFGFQTLIHESVISQDSENVRLQS